MSRWGGADAAQLARAVGRRTLLVWGRGAWFNLGRAPPRGAPAMTTTTAPLVTDSVTMLGADARGRAAIAASHGGIYAAYLAAKAGLKAVILSDAGVGRERAGVGGLAYP